MTLNDESKPQAFDLVEEVSVLHYLKKRRQKRKMMQNTILVAGSKEALLPSTCSDSFEDIE